MSLPPPRRPPPRADDSLSAAPRQSSVGLALGRSSTRTAPIVTPVSTCGAAKASPAKSPPASGATLREHPGHEPQPPAPPPAKSVPLRDMATPQTVKGTIMLAATAALPKAKQLPKAPPGEQRGASVSAKGALHAKPGAGRPEPGDLAAEEVVAAAAAEPTEQQVGGGSLPATTAVSAPCQGALPQEQSTPAATTEKAASSAEALRARARNCEELLRFFELGCWITGQGVASSNIDELFFKFV